MGFWGWDLGLVFLGWGFQVMSFVGPAGVLTGLELSILTCKNNPGKKLCVLHMHQYIHV